MQDDLNIYFAALTQINYIPFFVNSWSGCENTQIPPLNCRSEDQDTNTRSSERELGGKKLQVGNGSLVANAFSILVTTGFNYTTEG